MKFVPEYIFDSFRNADVNFLKSIGVKGVLLDIDNTLEPYENPFPGNDVLTWLESLKNNDIKCAFVSNNGKERVETFNKDLSLPYYYKAKKPFKKNVLSAMMDIGCEKYETVFIGDQILTDVLAAHNSGIRAILVPPIKDKTDIFTRFKRLLEKPFIRKYKRLEKKK